MSLERLKSLIICALFHSFKLKSNIKREKKKKMNSLLMHNNHFLINFHFCTTLYKIDASVRDKKSEANFEINPTHLIFSLLTSKGLGTE